MNVISEEANSIKQPDNFPSSSIVHDAGERKCTNRRQMSSLRKSFVKLTDDEIEKFTNRQYAYMRNQALMKANLKEVAPRSKTVHNCSLTTTVNRHPSIPKSKSYHDIHNIHDDTTDDKNVQLPLTIPEMNV